MHPVLVTCLMCLSNCCLLTSNKWLQAVKNSQMVIKEPYLKEPYLSRCGACNVCSTQLHSVAGLRAGSCPSSSQPSTHPEARQFPQAGGQQEHQTPSFRSSDQLSLRADCCVLQADGRPVLGAAGLVCLPVQCRRGQSRDRQDLHRHRI